MSDNLARRCLKIYELGTTLCTRRRIWNVKRKFYCHFSLHVYGNVNLFACVWERWMMRVNDNFENELKQKNRSFPFIRIGRCPKTANLWRSVAIVRDVCTSPAHSRHQIYFYIILERKRKKKKRKIIMRNWELKNIVFVRILNGLAHIFFSISSSFSLSLAPIIAAQPGIHTRRRR